MRDASDNRTLLLIELNEVNYELIKQSAKTLPFKNLKKLMNYLLVQTHTEDVYESDFLEPWVQWVSVHTGQPSTVHDVKHLGDVVNLKQPQIWETFSQNGLTSGIWGVMNGSRRSAEKCLFFVSDPWTFGELPFPAELRGLTNFAQYIAKNYLNLQPMLMLKHSVEYLLALFRYVGIVDLTKAFSLLAEGVIKFGPKNMVLGSFYEYTAAVAFLNERRRYRPALGIVFFNLLAHIQHHYWFSRDNVSEQLRYGFKVFDSVLGHMFADAADSTILVANGLSQSNTSSDEPWILYRPKDHLLMMRDFGIEFEKIEALMTHDGHIFLHSNELAEKAFDSLSQARICSKPLFRVERDRHNPLKLFYRLEFTDDTSSDTLFQINNRQLRFGDHFERVVLRTAKHCQDGFVLQNKQIMPNRIANHEIHDYICRYFGIEVDKTTEHKPCSAETLMHS